METPAATGQPAMAVVPVPAVFAGFGNSSLYVGDLDPNVNEGQLADMFSHVGQVMSVRVCRDQTKRSSLGYAYVNYSNPHDAANAMEILNFSPINGKPIRIMFSHRDPSIRKSGHGNIFIKNLDSTIDNKALHDTFAVFGTVLSCKVAVDSNRQSRGYGFVQFENEDSAQSAIGKLNGMLMNGKKVYVGRFVRRQERNQANGSPKFTNVFVKNLSDSATEEDLKKVFGSYGDITSLVVMRDENGKSKCFGFVNYQSHESAAAAVDCLNGITIDGKVWYVGRAQRKVERESELRAKFEQERSSKYEKLQAANLYLKNLDENVTDDNLKELFSEFGNITSCKVMLDPQGVSRGCGFVAFSTPEEAAKAMNEMNGKMISRKPLYVAVAQRKEERKAKLQAHFSQVQTPSGLSPLPSGIPAFQTGASRLAPQQLYYGPGAPGLMHPQQAGYGFRQQLMPGMRQGVPQNFVMPYNVQRQQGQLGQRMGGVRRGGNAQHMHHQGFRYMQNARNGMDPSVVPQGLIGSAMMPVQRSGPMPIATLTSSLASASPEQQKDILGGELYPLVQRLAPNQASKVTGMLLEMDQPEVLHLIESPDALKTKVGEALKVLAAAAESEVSDQLGSIVANE